MEQPYANKFKTLEEMDNFLKKKNKKLTKLPQDEMETFKSTMA